MNEIDKIFKKEIESYREAPSSEMWKNIESGLDKQELIRYKKRFVLLFRSSLTLIILLISALLYNSYYVSPPRKAEASKTLSNDNLQKSTPSIANERSSTQLNSTSSIIARLQSGSRNKYSLPVNETAAARHMIGTSSIAPPVTMSAYADHIISPEKSLKYTRPYGPSAYFAAFAPLSGSVRLPNYILPSGGGKKMRNISRSSPLLSLRTFLSPDLTANRMNEVYDFDDDHLSDYRDREHADFSYTVGFLADFRVKNNWSLETGLSLSNTYSSIQPSTVKAVKDESGQYTFKIASSLGFVKVPGTSVQNPQATDTIRLEKESIQHLQYVSIPISIKYNFPQRRRIQFFTSAGLAANFITRGEVEVSTPAAGSVAAESVKNNIEGLRKKFFSAMFSAGMNYNLNKHVALVFSPRLRVGITPVNRNTPVSSTPASLSIESGILYKL